jgi:hypothetical protein
MKSKKVFTKKLALNKSTIADLNITDLKRVLGGVSNTNCNTDCITNCIRCPSVKCK